MEKDQPEIYRCPNIPSTSNFSRQMGNCFIKKNSLRVEPFWRGRMCGVSKSSLNNRTKHASRCWAMRLPFEMKKVRLSGRLVYFRTLLNASGQKKKSKG